MEDSHNNPIPPTQPAPTAQAPEVQQPKDSKMLIIALLFALFLIVATVFILMGNKNSVGDQSQTTISPTSIPEVTSPTSTGSTEENEVEQIDVTDTAPTDFPAVEKDVNGL